MTNELEFESPASTDETPDAMSDWYSDRSATLGDRLTAAREEAGLTAQALATHMGVSEDTLAAWEADMSEPRANRISMLSGVLNVSLRWLLTGVGEGVEHPPAEDAVLPGADLAAVLAEVRILRAETECSVARLVHLEDRLVAATEGP